MRNAVEKIRENRVRRVAERRGYRLQKSRRRDPLALDFGGYILVDAQTNVVVVGAEPWGYAADLDSVEDFLNPQAPAKRRKA